MCDGTRLTMEVRVLYVLAVKQLYGTGTKLLLQSIIIDSLGSRTKFSIGSAELLVRYQVRILSII